MDAAARGLLRGRPVIAASPRLAAALADEGFSAIVPAPGARPAQLLGALAAAVAAGRFR
jgi:uroporphyrinogen-III synthase